MTENGNDARSNNFLSLFYMVKDAWILVFSDVSTGEVIWHRITNCENEVICMMHLVCIGQVKSYCLKGQLYRKIIKEFLLKINFSNVVFITIHYILYTA